MSEASISYDVDHGVLLALPNTSTTPGILAAQLIAPKHITDGLSKTMIVVEVTGRGADMGRNPTQLRGTWSVGYNILAVAGKINRDPSLAWQSTGNGGNDIFCDHPGGTNILFCDGSAHFLSDTADPKIVLALA